ncbi:nucleic acid-binding proteins superfamily [Actinidia rufa]|uniref:Nucleic acid-binding proteins superfamily n=1 Tax=Actinidia rufa TaxID=165716 RepID=A0A7J0F2G2_9ERIC|nr:nucleic acid-binding proteins superfamily [Actinidia rufa]
MPIFTAALGSVSGIAFLSHLFASDPTSLSHHHHQSSSSSSSSYSVSSLTNLSFNFPNCCRNSAVRRHPFHAVKVSVSGDAKIEAPNGAIEDSSASPENVRQARIIQADQGSRKLIFSEKEAMWSKFSQQINVGDLFHGQVGSVEDYGAFVHLRFPDGSYHLTGLVHVSEVSWDLIQDVRDVLSEGEEVRVKVIKIDREKSRLTLSIKQLEEDPLLETLEKVIPQDGSVDLSSSATSSTYNIQPLPGLEAILEELLSEEGVTVLLNLFSSPASIRDIRISRQEFEKRVVSQDLQLWLSNAPAIGQQFTLLARAGRQVQEIQLTTSLDQEGIKRALQRVLERVP